MDAVRNPYAPGAGTPPPELAGRDALLEKVRVALQRTLLGKPTKSALMVGLRGVGKTVLLERMRQDAEEAGIQTLEAEAPEGRSLPAILAPQIRRALIRLSLDKRAKDYAIRALKALAGFAKALKFKYSDIEVGLDYEPERGLADNADLESDLIDLLMTAGEAAAQAETALAMFIDELQYVEEEQLAALVVGLHRAAQRRLPILLVGAGLPQLRGQMGRAKSYAERLFDFPEVGPLDRKSAEEAIVLPAQAEEVAYEKGAVDLILEQAQGYPYFLQEWGKRSWDVAANSPISRDDVKRATAAVIADLDESFFRVRFDRLTPLERRYLRAMAELGAGPHRSGDVAKLLKRQVTTLGPARNQLLAKGMIWSPSHGDTAFTVPLFDQFMRRIMPGDDWQ